MPRFLHRNNCINSNLVHGWSITQQMLSKMSGWNVFIKTCVKMGEGNDEGPISHPFKEYSRERFPSAIIPPTKAEKAHAELMKQQGELQTAPAQFVQAPQSVGSHVMIANPAAATVTPFDNTQYYAQQLQQQQQQLLLQHQQQLHLQHHQEQQQQMAMMYANTPMAMQQSQQVVPGMYYDVAPGQIQQQQQIQMQQYQSAEQQMQQQYMAHQPFNNYQQQTSILGMGGGGGQIPMGQYWDGSNGMGIVNNGMLPMASPYGMSMMQQQQQQPQQPPPLDPNRPTYAQNAIGVEVAMRERMAALLATRQR